MKKFECLMMACMYGGLLSVIFNSNDIKAQKDIETISCHANMPSRFAATGQYQVNTFSTNNYAASHEAMVWIKGGDFTMGCSDKEGRPDEYPQHPVKVDGFWMDATEVTNAQFQKFAEATGFITTAEKAPDWNEMKKQLPPGTPKPDESLLVAASLVFTPPPHAISLNNASQWWSWKKGADWRHPEGHGSNIEGKDSQFYG